MSIIDRYLFKEAARAWAAVIFVLLAIMLGSGFARFLNRAAVGKLDENVLLPVVAISSVENLVVLMPVSVLLAIMLSLGRHYRDNEITVVSACGRGIAALYKPFLLLAVLLSIATAWLSLWVSPETGNIVERMRKEGRQSVELSVNNPGRFQVLDEGRGVLFVESISSNEVTLENVFIWAEQASYEAVVVAETGVQQVDPATGKRSLVLLDGVRYEGLPDQANYRILNFEEHGLSAYTPPVRKSSDLDLIPTGILLRSDKPELRAELQRRISAPLAVLVLTLLAVPLAYPTPRQGRYGKLVTGIVIYLLYSNLLGVAQVWVEDGKVPVWIGLWWVHLGTALLALVLAARRGGYLLLPRRSRSIRKGVLA